MKKIIYGLLLSVHFHHVLALNWLDPHASEGQVSQLRSFLALEEQEKGQRGGFPVQFLEDDHKSYHYGCSLPGLTQVKELCLTEIQSRYQDSGGKRIFVADIGAGHGFMSWLMLVAGGQLFALEPNREAINYLRNTQLKKAKPFLREGETLKALVQLSSKDLLTAEDSIDQNKFEVVWVGNVLHCIHPRKLGKFIAALYAMTKPGGKVFITVDVPGKDGSGQREAWKLAQGKNMQFPGYMATNTKLRLDRAARAPVLQVASQSVVSLVETDTIEPGAIHHGQYIPGRGLVSHEARHETTTALHVFDHDVMSREFKKAGFEEEAVYYTSLDVARAEKIEGSHPSLDMILEQEPLRLVFIGKKPEGSL